MKRRAHNKEEGIGNRESASYAKKSGSWYIGCDRCIVTPGEKCPICGHTQHKNGNKRRRKGA